MKHQGFAIIPKNVYGTLHFEAMQGVDERQNMPCVSFIMMAMKMMAMKLSKSESEHLIRFDRRHAYSESMVSCHCQRRSS